MAIFDAQNQFSNAQAVTVTAISTNVIDTLSGANSFTNTAQNLGGFSGSMFLVVLVGTVFAGGTSVAISLESDSTANLATAPVVHYSSGAILTAALTANNQILVIPLPYGNFKRFMGLRYTVVGTYTTGTLTSFLTREVETWKSYAVAQASNL